MFKPIVAFAVFFSAPVAHAQITCLGFRPEVTAVCDSGSKVYAYEEARCGAGRDGILNDDTFIYRVDGPTWREPGAGAEITFLMEDGEAVTVTGCEVVEQ